MNGWTGEEGHERREAVRALLHTPVLRREGRHRRLVDQARRHEKELRAWFDRQLGWPLVVERDLIRLLKIPEDPGRFPDLTVPTPRQCALYCLLLAVLADCGGQTVISELADRVTALTTAHRGLRRFEATSTRERRDLVAALRRLTEGGVLRSPREAGVTADSEQAYVAGHGNAVYDVNHRLASSAVVCPVPPSQADAPDTLLRFTEGDPGLWARTDTELRQALMRRLVDDPVVYVEDLPSDQQEYLSVHREELAAELVLGLDTRVEVRAEGLAIVDSRFSDTDFPAASAVSVAALALADLLAGEAVPEQTGSFVVGHDRLSELVDLVAEQIRRVVPNIERKPVDGSVVLRYSVPVLMQFGLVDPHDDGVLVRPALARYRDPSGRGARVTGEALLLFGQDLDMTPRRSKPHTAHLSPAEGHPDAIAD
ncbi:TIGR02678 family protein [Streptomyces odonnellii]|uniref:TIGR02678 family protein n=1 Tax=Streptomyces odonnellii TaxID=1417980 RepID=UPI000625B14F|nr:TIGR02678 family protein [Streptomyces odonnellii]